MLSAADEQLLRVLTERARSGGLKLIGEGHLPGRLAKMVVDRRAPGDVPVLDLASPHSGPRPSTSAAREQTNQLEGW